MQTADQLRTLLQLDYRPADLGDTPEQYQSRFDLVVTQTLARTEATDAQREAGARYLLISAQLRQLNRQLEEIAVSGEITLRQGLTVRMGQLRYDQQAQLRLSGLPGGLVAVRPVSVSVDVQAGL